MGLAKQQIIGPHTFATKGAAIEFIQKILYSHDLRVPITGDDHEFLMELLKKHPRVTEKTGSGVTHFTVEPAQGGTRCFYITRTDDTRDDFSFLKSLGR